MNTLFLENKKDAIKFAKQINEAFEKEFDKKTPEMKKIFLQLARDCEFFDENLYK